MNLHYHKELIIKSILFLLSLSNLALAQYIAKDLVDLPQFVENALVLRDENGMYCSVPQKPSEGREEKVLMKSKKVASSESHEEKVLMRANPGMDGRERVHETTQRPYTVFGQLSSTFSDVEQRGSGVLVGPHHVLTCGHKVYDKDSRQWAQSITFLLALSDERAPFGEARGVRMYVHKKYIEEGNHDYNIALIIIDKSLGFKLGWAGLMHLPDNEILQSTVSLTGYPGDKGAKQMWTMQGQIKALDKDRLFYEIDTAPGQGGSPIWLVKDGESPYVIGVHILAEGAHHTGNSGVRLSLPKLKELIEQCIAQTYQYATPLILPQDSGSATFLKDYVKKIKR